MNVLFQNIDESHLGDGVHRKRSSQESQESDNDDVPPAQRPVKLSVEGGPVVNVSCGFIIAAWL